MYLKEVYLSRKCVSNEYNQFNFMFNQNKNRTTKLLHDHDYRLSIIIFCFDPFNLSYVTVKRIKAENGTLLAVVQLQRATDPAMKYEPDLNISIDGRKYNYKSRRAA